MASLRNPQPDTPAVCQTTDMKHGMASLRNPRPDTPAVLSNHGHEVWHGQPP